MAVGAGPPLAAILEEEARMSWLRATVDGLSRSLRDDPLTYEEAVLRTAAARRAILARFPMKGDLYEWVYAPRFARILIERFGKAPRQRVVRL